MGQPLTTDTEPGSVFDGREPDPDLERRFAHHPPRSDEVIHRHEMIRAEIKHTAYRVRQMVPQGREQSLALTKLEEAMMWANAGIARGISAKADPDA